MASFQGMDTKLDRFLIERSIHPISWGFQNEICYILLEMSYKVLKVVKIESCQNLRLPKLKVAKIENC